MVNTQDIYVKGCYKKTSDVLKVTGADGFRYSVWKKINIEPGEANTYLRVLNTTRAPWIFTFFDKGKTNLGFLG